MSVAIQPSACAGWCISAGELPLEPVASLDTARYMGTWYEIAKYPNWFQKKCVSGTKAEYTLLESGKVEVINRCTLADGSLNEVVGVARQLGGSRSAKLEVSFAPKWLSALPFVWGNYWVDIDPQYQLVAVSEPKKEYLWVLSRTSQVPHAHYDALLERLKKQGFDLSRLEKTLP